MNQANRSLDSGSCQIRVLRVNDAPASSHTGNPGTAWAFWQEHIATSAWFTSILLNVRYAVIAGTSSASALLRSRSLIHARSYALPSPPNAYAFVLAHNHPSGKSKPCLADHDTTRTIQTAASILKIHFVDHLIIGAAASSTDQPFFSFSIPNPAGRVFFSIGTMG